jgi:hypothetical protein
MIVEVSTAYEMTTLRFGETDGDVVVARQLTNDWYTEQFTEQEEQEEQEEPLVWVGDANKIWVYDGESKSNQIWLGNR